METTQTINVKSADGNERAYITTSQGLTLEVEELREKTTLDNTGKLEKFLIGHAHIERHAIALLHQPTIKAKRVEIQIRAKSFGESALNTDGKSRAGELEIIHTEQDDELDHVDGWAFILYIPEEAVHSLLELVAFNKLRRLFTHVTPDSFVVDAARRYSPLNMPVDFFAQSGFSRGAVNWVSTDGDSIDLRAYSESWTDEEKISVGLTNASLNTKKLMELIKYVKWIAMTLIVLTAVTLLKG